MKDVAVAYCVVHVLRADAARRLRFQEPGPLRDAAGSELEEHLLGEKSVYTRVNRRILLREHSPEHMLDLVRRSDPALADTDPELLQLIDEAYGHSVWRHWAELMVKANTEFGHYGPLDHQTAADVILDRTAVSQPRARRRHPPPVNADSTTLNSLWPPLAAGGLIAALARADQLVDLTDHLRDTASRHHDTAWVHPAPSDPANNLHNMSQDLLDAIGAVGLRQPRAAGERHLLRALTHLVHGPVRHLVIDDADTLTVDTLEALHEAALIGRSICGSSSTPVNVPPDPRRVTSPRSSGSRAPASSSVRSTSLRCGNAGHPRPHASCRTRAGGSGPSTTRTPGTTRRPRTMRSVAVRPRSASSASSDAGAAP